MDVECFEVATTNAEGLSIARGSVSDSRRRLELRFGGLFER
jgi:hypothetical protein